MFPWPKIQHQVAVELLTMGTVELMSGDTLEDAHEKTVTALQMAYDHVFGEEKSEEKSGGG